MSVKYLEDKSVFLFAGVGNFRALRKQVAALTADIDCAMELSDHQQYDQTLLQQIRDSAAKAGSDVILTTGKDWVKLGDFDSRDIDYVRMEAMYTFPNGTNYMHIIFPRAQPVPATEMDLQAEDAVAVTLTFESKRADSEVVGGSSVWDSMPLGWIKFT